MDKSSESCPNYRSQPTPLLFRNLTLLIILCISGCASESNAPASASSGKTIAVMPLDNQTNSVAGALYMREVMVALLKHKGYAPIPIAKTDQELANQFGISMGGQIIESDIPKIAAGLGVEAIMTGRLKTFGAVLLSYNEVSASFTLYIADAWQPAWTYDGAANAPFSPVRSDDIRVQLIGGLISNILDRSLEAPLKEAVSRYYQQLQHTLPAGRDIHH
jgi:hypothetical protein